MGEFVLNLLSGGIIGLITSYTASHYFRKQNNEKNLPKIKVSKQLIESSRKDKTPAIAFKLINETVHDLSNIKIIAEGLENKGVNNNTPRYHLSFLCERSMLFIRKFDKKDSDAHYACVINLYHPEINVITKAKKFECIRISVYAECPYYSTTAVVVQEYKIDPKLLNKHHIFASGNTMEVLSTKK